MLFVCRVCVSEKLNKVSSLWVIWCWGAAGGCLSADRLERTSHTVLEIIFILLELQLNLFFL